MMRRLYALFVAVDKYANPQITPLRGCVKDIRNLESFLRDRYQGTLDLQVRLLENESATYRNVIDGFRSHLMQAGPEDTVWFHFSGHGSEELSAFPKEVEPTGMEQTLLCHDSQTGQVQNLADKELAALLHEVSVQFPDGSAKEAPHIIVSLDACHSGSGTRDIGDELIIPRATPASGNSRPLESYYDGYYARQDKIDIPLSRHLLMSACEHIQTAGDTTKGGIFSSSLVQALKETKGDVNYVDLFQRTRASAKRMREFQNPQFQAISNFNPFTRFLTGESLGKPSKYEVVHENGDWYIKCGAVHGLPTNPAQPVEVELRTPDPEDKKLGDAVITSVGAQKSKLDVKTGFSLKSLIDQLVPGDEAYQGVVMKFPAPPFFVRLNEEGGDLASIRKLWRDSSNIVIAGSREEENEAIVEVSGKDGEMVITDKFLNQRAFSADGTDENAAGIIMDALERIANWYRTWGLKNENAHSKLSELVGLQVQTEDKSGQYQKLAGSQVKLYLNEDNTISNTEFGLPPQMRMLLLHPEVIVKNAKQDLFFYLLQFRDDYSIACDEDEVKFVFDAQQYKTPYEVTQALWKSTTSAGGLKPGQDLSTIWFKLITTTEELDIAQLIQQPLGSDRSSGTITLQRAKISNDWWVHNMEITVVRQDNALSPEKPVLLADGQVRIEPHARLQARVSAENSTGGTRSADPVHVFNALQHASLELLSFNTARTLAPRNILEFDDIRMPDETDLESDPLEIVLQNAPDEAYTLPVMFDGSQFVTVGDSGAHNGTTVVRIREIPPVRVAEGPGGQVQHPFHAEVQDRSLFQTAKLAFFKLVLKKEEEANLLRRVAFDGDGNFDQTRDNLSSKVAGASKILLVIHGLFGNTRSVVRDLLAHSPAELAPYDLVITFDYENLNQKLDETAAIMHDALETIGIGPDKPVTVLAHGSGGLVARWWIEQLNGKGSVQKLLMAGTPNMGTAYGKIGGYRKFASSAMDLALNFVPDLVPGAGLIMKALRIGGDLTGSLADMHPSSEFLQKLNSSSDPGVQYEIRCGDVSLAGSGPGTGNAFTDRISSRLGSYFQGNRHHDLFCTVESMQNREAWTGRNPLPVIHEPAAVSHFAYFNQGLAQVQAPGMGPSPDTAVRLNDSDQEQPGESKQEEPDPEPDPEPEVKAQVLPETNEAKTNESGTEEGEESPSEKVKRLAGEISELRRLLSQKESELDQAIRDL